MSYRTTQGPCGLALLALLAACGGGAAKPAPLPVVTYGNSTLNGTYTVFTFSGTDTTPCEVGTGTAVADAQGHLEASLTTNRSGVIDGPTAVSLLYDVATGGSFTVRDALDPDAFHAYGGLSSDGAFAAFASIGDGDRPSITLLMRHGAGYTNAGIDLKLNALAFGTTPDSNDIFLVRGPTSSDGEGGLSPHRLYGVRTHVGEIPFTNQHELQFGGHFSTAPDGASTLSTASEDFSGALVLNGLAAGWAGALGAGQTPSVYFVARQVASPTNALFAGDYWHVALLRLRHGGFRTYTGPVWSDGTRNVVVTPVTNSDGVVTSDASWTSTYAAWNMGEFGIDHFAGGFITSDGRLVVAGTGLYPSLGNGLCFFIRK